MPASYEPFLKEVLIDEKSLQDRIAELGAEISHDYRDSNSFMLVCLLKGGVMFLTDLMRCITVTHEIDFLAVSSYGRGTRASTGKVRIEMDLTGEAEGKDILIVEDIIDSGYTLKFVMDMLNARHPRSLKLCALLDKPSRRSIAIPIHYTGFQIEDKFVFGYGLDLDEKFRNMPFIGVARVEGLAHE
jgi:hypoxanthine phosphoribosyltransferase